MKTKTASQAAFAIGGFNHALTRKYIAGRWYIRFTWATRYGAPPPPLPDMSKMKQPVTQWRNQPVGPR
jgi:hypothetical protein